MHYALSMVALVRMDRNNGERSCETKWNARIKARTSWGIHGVQPASDRSRCPVKRIISSECDWVTSLDISSVFSLLSAALPDLTDKQVTRSTSDSTKGISEHRCTHHDDASAECELH